MNIRQGQALPELSIDVTPTFVIATALATRDFQDVHHDRDKAVARGGKDIFINILTTTGLVQRYVTDWAGSDALVQLTEGVRMVGELLGVDPGQVRVGMPVRAEFVKIDGDLTLPAWREDRP